MRERGRGERREGGKEGGKEEEEGKTTYACTYEVDGENKKGESCT